MVKRALVVITAVLVVALAIFVFSRQQAPLPAGSDGAPESGGTVGGASESTGLPAGATEAVVEYVHDGDTLFLEDGRKVRLLGVDTPEIGENLECWGDEAVALTRQLLPEGAHVWVLPDVEPLDQYGRSLLFVYTDDATNINLELLRQGAAEVEMYQPNVMFRDEIERAEQQAYDAGLGMWGAC